MRGMKEQEPFNYVIMLVSTAFLVLIVTEWVIYKRISIFGWLLS